jgi:predicted dienelactone hydrolase
VKNLFLFRTLSAAFCVSLSLAGLPIATAKASSTSSATYSVIGPVTVTLHDKARNKDLAVAAFYPPKATGKLPVIVFSHGAGGAPMPYAPLMDSWASHGYICLMPVHADAGALLPALRNGGVWRELNNLLHDPQNGINRVEDMKLVIDSLPEIGKKIPALALLMDLSRVGVGGHSFGAYTAQVMDGAKTTLTATPLADPRPQAFLLLSAQGHGEMGFDTHSWENLKRPTMAMTGSLDRGLNGQSAEQRLDPYTYAPAGDKYGVFIDGASHFSFSGRAVSTKPLQQRLFRMQHQPAKNETEIFDQIAKTSLLFWNAYLKNEAGAKASLRSGNLSAASGGITHVQWK